MALPRGFRKCRFPRATTQTWRLPESGSAGWISTRRIRRRRAACLDIANKGDKPETLMEGVRGFELSADGKKMLIRKQNDLLIVDAAAKGAGLKDPKTLADSQVDLKNWTFSVIPTDEFREGFWMRGGCIATTSTTATCTA